MEPPRTSPLFLSLRGPVAWPQPGGVSWGEAVFELGQQQPDTQDSSPPTPPGPRGLTCPGDAAREVFLSHTEPCVRATSGGPLPCLAN